MNNKRAFLIILDGWGLGQQPDSDAILKADTPFFDTLIKKYPHETLVTFGEDVGLPEGQMGNSEVGHLNIGAGRVVYQELARINKAVKEKTLHEHPVVLEAMKYAKKNDKALHFIGLVSDGGVHSHINHLKALCDIADEQKVSNTYIHALTDGRDCDPKSGYGFLKDFLDHIDGKTPQLASVIGRYYGMDRDKRWERVKLAYDLLVKGEGEPSKDVLATVKKRYEEGETDEFLKPIVLTGEKGAALSTIKEGDAVFFFNFRTDRPRELTTVLSQQDMEEFGMAKLTLHFTTMTRYDDTYEKVNVVFETEDIVNTLGEVMEKAGKTQVRIAETEKYPHVTFFFSGGREKEFEGEKRILIPSPKVATYDLQPEMSAPEVTSAILEEMETGKPDFICLNFANTDMVGHTGVFEAAAKAAETVDQCLRKIVEKGLEQDYHFLIIADHGNSDYMINEDGSPNTAHSKNPVPVIYVSNDAEKKKLLSGGKLADVAPTLLKIMELPMPEEMTGSVLIE